MSNKPYAFGSSVKRFTSTGLHPKFVLVSSNPIGPGHYHPKRATCNRKTHSGSWKIQLDSQEFSKYLGFKNPRVLTDRLFDQTLGGPGTYDLTQEPKKGASVLPDVGFGREKRFHDLIKDETLPPGTHTMKQLRTKFGTVPRFEWDGGASRFRNVEPPYRQAPNRYRLPHYSITEKVVSKRGPYDTFTGPRDETTIKNYFAPSLFKPPDKVYPMTNALDHLLNHPSKRRCGKFLLADRFPPEMQVVATNNGFSMFQKDPHYPGPAEYNVSKGIAKAKTLPYPFNSSQVNARPPQNWKIHPGPERYKIKYPKCPLKKGRKQSWFFISGVERELVRVQSYSNFTY